LKDEGSSVTMILKHAERVLRVEAEAIAALIPRLDEKFIQAVELRLQKLFDSLSTCESEPHRSALTFKLKREGKERTAQTLQSHELRDREPREGLEVTWPLGQRGETQHGLCVDVMGLSPSSG